MIPVQVLTETEERYRQREDARNAKSRKLATGDVLAADSPERVQMRLARLARAGVAGEAVLSVALERVLGRNDLVALATSTSPSWPPGPSAAC